MPSPFPGMDPYLENPNLWPDVHHGLIGGVQELLTPILRPRFVVRVELRTFIVQPDDPAGELYVVPDARIVERQGTADSTSDGGVAVRVRKMAPALDITGLTTEVARERFLEIRDPIDRKVVTVIEIVSPANKANGSAGRRAFRRKRAQVAASDANWFEIDLLRSGTPTWRAPGVPRSAYRAYADRTTATDGRRQLAWPIVLRARLPVLPVPLRPGDADVPLDLQAALDLAYDRAGYDMDVDYARPPAPPLGPEDATWAEELLQARKPNV